MDVLEAATKIDVIVKSFLRIGGTFGQVACSIMAAALQQVDAARNVM